MTVKELKTKLEGCPENMDVFIAPKKTDFNYGLVNKVDVRKINFKEEPDGKTLAKATVVVIEEDW